MDSEPYSIGNNHQLFLDDYLIAASEGVTRRVCPVVKHPANPVIRPEEPWEPSGYMTFGSIMYDKGEGIYKAWCHSVVGAPSLANVNRLAGGGTFYFVSDDGVTWRRPKLDAVLVDGRPSHIVSVWNPNWTEGDDPFQEIFGVFKDEQESDPSRRYKMGFLYLKWNYHGPNESKTNPGQLRALGVAYSPDGVHWEAIEGPVAFNTADGATHWFRDPVTNRFVLFGRGKHYNADMVERYKNDPRFAHNDGRAVRRSESDDFLEWEPAEGQIVMSADARDGPGDEVYGLSVFPYEGIYIGMVQVLHSYAEHVYLEIQLAVSRDSVHFQRLSDRSAFIPVGGVGSWDRFNNSLATNPPHCVGDDLRIYYAGRSYLHSGIHQGPDNGKERGILPLAGVGIGTTKLDRFAGMEGTFATGTLRTKPVLVEGSSLHVNAHAPFGRVGVSLLRPDGTPIEGATADVQGIDAVVAPVAVDLSPLAGQAVALEFKITNAQLYSFWMD
ncbi:MAG: hypothetical protein Q7T82_10790 [Armatimonadota bacterium]|nr:hypothetical protein [Armatimonadota bacterium]